MKDRLTQMATGLVTCEACICPFKILNHGTS